MANRNTVLPLAVFILVFFAVWTLRATVFITVDESIESAAGRSLYSNALRFVLWVVPAIAYALCVRRKSPAEFLGISVWPGLHMWASSLVAMAGFFGCVAVVELTLGGKRVSGDRLLALSLAVLALQHFVSPFLEEVLFRGLVMKELQTLLSRTKAAVLTSILFVGVHLPYWLTHGGLAPAMAANSIGVFLFSLFACWLYSRSSSVWPPTVAHIANNLLPMVLSAGDS